MAKNTQNKQTAEPQKPTADYSKFAIGKQNFKLLAIGFAIIILGFILMVGGGSTPDTFDYNGLFGFQRRTLAPLVVLAGFAFEIYAIMKKPKE